MRCFALVVLISLSLAHAQYAVNSIPPPKGTSSGALCVEEGDCKIKGEVCGTIGALQRRICKIAARDGEDCDGDADCASKFVCGESGACEKGSRGGLGAGIIAGIVGGAVLGLLVCAALVIWCVMRGRRKWEGDGGPEGA